MKLSGPAATVVLVVVIIAVLLGGYFYARHATGADVVDQLHADMKKIPGGRSPVSPEFVEQMKQRQAGGAQGGSAGR